MFVVLVRSGCHDKITQAGQLAQQTLSPSSGGSKSEIKVPSGLGSGVSSLPGLQTAACSLGVHVAFPQYACRKKGEGNVKGVSSPERPRISSWGSHPCDLI